MRLGFSPKMLILLHIVEMLGGRDRNVRSKELGRVVGRLKSHLVDPDRFPQTVRTSVAFPTPFPLSAHEPETPLKCWQQVHRLVRLLLVSTWDTLCDLAVPVLLV